MSVQVCQFETGDQLLAHYRAVKRRIAMGAPRRNPKPVSIVHHEPKPKQIGTGPHRVGVITNPAWPRCNIITDPLDRASIALVIEIVAQRHGVTAQDITGASRADRIALIRHIAAFLCVQMTGHSLPLIGKFMKRDHKVIFYARDKIARKMAEDAEFAASVSAIRLEIEGIVNFSRIMRRDCGYGQE